MARGRRANPRDSPPPERGAEPADEPVDDPRPNESDSSSDEELSSLQEQQVRNIRADAAAKAAAKAATDAIANLFGEGGQLAGLTTFVSGTEQSPAQSQTGSRTAPSGGTGGVTAGVAFAVNPGAHFQDDLLNYKDSRAQDFYDRATKSVYSKKESKFDMTPERFSGFEERIFKHATTYGLKRDGDKPNSIVMIPKSIDGTGKQMGPYTDIMETYEGIDPKAVKEYEDYLKEDKSRQTQNLDILYNVIWNSIDEDGLELLARYKSHYTDEHDKSFRRGLSLWVTIVQQCTFESLASLQRERERIIKLPEYAELADGDVRKIGEEIDSALRGVSRYTKGGASYDEEDLLIILWETYGKVRCKEFSDWLKLKKYDHHEGRCTTANELIAAAEAKHKTLVKDDKWMRETVDQVKLLMAQNAELRKDMKKVASKFNKGRANGSGKEPKESKPAGRKSDDTLTDEERFIHKKGRTKPKWLAKQYLPEDRHQVRWWNGGRYIWTNGKKWVADKNPRFPRAADKVLKRQGQWKGGQEANKKKKEDKQIPPVSAFEAVTSAHRDQRSIGNASSDSDDSGSGSETDESNH